MNWGKWIVLTFVLFAVFIGSLVVICMREDISLVSRNYYNEELAYQKQIDKMNNANALPEKPLFRVVGKALEIQYADFEQLKQGELTLFCPSNARFDKRFSLSGSRETITRIDVSGLPKAMYKARMTWVMNGQEYAVEEVVIL